MVGGQHYNFIINKTPHVAVIGAGELGSRHLQGLSRINHDINITVVEPNIVAINTAKERYNEMPTNSSVCTISYFESIKSFTCDIDVAIIATNADIRRKVVEDLLEKVDVKYLILEKVAFQSIQDFEIVMELMGEKNIKGWVNCTRRIYPFFRSLRQQKIQEKKITMDVRGSNWGLASNAIHMVDLFSYLTEQKEVTIDATNLDKKIYQSKRQGFIELGGRLMAQTSKGDILHILDKKNTTIPYLMKIETDTQEIEIYQKKILYRSSQKNGETKPKKLPFFIPLQSEVTHLIVEEILQTGNSELTNIKESYNLHKPLIEAFNKHLSDINGKPYRVCPIT